MFLRRQSRRNSKRNHARMVSSLPANVEILEERSLLSAGTIDLSFGQNGVVTTDFSTDVQSNLNRVNEILLQPDGKIIAVGQALAPDSGSDMSGTLQARYFPDGSLDTSFSFDGKVFTSGATAQSAVLQDDGKIVTATSALERFQLRRYLTDGSLDLEFGVNGTALAEIDSGYISYVDILIDNDGRITVSGIFSPIDTSMPREIVVARFLPDGTPDRDFASDGVSRPMLDGYEYFDVHLAQQDDKLLVASNSSPLSPTILRLRPDGVLDQGFGNNGVTTLENLNPFDVVRDLEVQSNGRIVLVGRAFFDEADGTTDADFGVVRLLPDGSPDLDFGGNGFVKTTITDSFDFAERVAIQKDGRILVAGETSPDLGISFGGIETNIAIVRYLPDGTLDATFSFDGKVETDVFGFKDQAAAIAIQPDGKFLIGGASSRDEFVTTDFTLIRYNNDPIVTLQDVTINDGNPQRSKVNSLTVAFDGTATFEAGAFELRDGEGNLIDLVIASTFASGQTTAVITFAGGTIEGGSLADGRYTLTINGDAIWDHLGRPVDADGDGSFGGTRILAFHRLFGDIDGDSDVDKSDRSAFLAVLDTNFGDPSFLWFLDFDEDGDIDKEDRRSFNKRFRTSV